MQSIITAGVFGLRTLSYLLMIVWLDYFMKLPRNYLTKWWVWPQRLTLPIVNCRLNRLR